MRRSVEAIGLLPALSLVAGVLAGLALPSTPLLLAVAAGAPVIAAAAYLLGWMRATTVAIVAGFAACGALNAAHARDTALETPLRRLLDEQFTGFTMSSLGPAGVHAPIRTRARILEDAAMGDGFVSLGVAVRAVHLHGNWRAIEGNVRLSVSGEAAATAMAAWRAGRTIEAPITFRRPARFLNEGVSDFERDLALGGTTLLGSVKSGLLVEVTGAGSWLEETASAARAGIRRAVSRWIGARSAMSAALVTAVLIGDRAAIPDAVRDALQAAGTYHVIAISGGNIAVFVLLVSAIGALLGLGPRRAAALTIAVLLAYAAIVVSGPSVRRAVLVAVLYLAARVLDHRAPAWHAAAVACAVLLVAWPLDVLDAGFVLTFGAAAALLASPPVVGSVSLPAPLRIVAVAIVASVAVEAVLLPVQALVFARVTLAGIALNLAAVPLMTVAQVAGLAVVGLDLLGGDASGPAWAADAAVRALLGSAALVDVAPWLSGPVHPPGWAAVGAYYAALVSAAFARRLRPAAIAAWMVMAALLATGAPVTTPLPGRESGDLRVTMLDVGQAEAILLEPPGALPLLIDTGGSPFGSGLDIGARVVVPALRARGVTELAALLVTHGDPDHIGGAAGVLAHVAVSEAWFGVRVPGHLPGDTLLADLARRHTRVRQLRAGEAIEHGGLRFRVLNPPEPDWERRRVRNDDSVVIEVVCGDVAILLLGDVSAGVERALVPQLTPARLRVLKVAHHGSRTSTSRELLDAWRPHLALVSAGRGNTFGHPVADVIQRLESAGARVLRTDRDGQITVTTDGRTVRWRTFFRGGRP